MWSTGASAELPCFLMAVAMIAFFLMEDPLLPRIATGLWCMANAIWCAYDMGVMKANWSWLPLGTGMLMLFAYVFHAWLKGLDTPAQTTQIKPSPDDTDQAIHS
jgi:hypothetical protein